jgi:hypothetical protein
LGYKKTRKDGMKKQLNYHLKNKKQLNYYLNELSESGWKDWMKYGLQKIVFESGGLRVVGLLGRPVFLTITSST